MALFDEFMLICTAQEVLWAPTIAFEDFRQFQGRQWQFTAVFVLDMVFNGVIYGED
jgi:hypothetical protein